MGNVIEPSDPPKDPILAMILSLLLCGGAGHIYLGQTVKGVVIIFVSFFTCGIGWILGTIDAYLIAQRLKEGKSVGEWEFFWQNK